MFFQYDGIEVTEFSRESRNKNKLCNISRPVTKNTKELYICAVSAINFNVVQLPT
jgi:hypothetical protein